MLISIAYLAYIPSGILFAGLPTSTIHASLASANSPFHSTSSSPKGYDSVDRFSKAVVFAGAAALLAHASGNDIVQSFSGSTKPPRYSATKTYPQTHTFASEGHQPCRTPNTRNNGRSSIRGGSSDSLRSRNYNLRSRTRANQSSGPPPSEDPEGDPLLSAGSSERGPTRPSSPTAPHAPVEGSGPPPPPPPASSTGSVADDNKPLSAVLSVLEPILAIYILALLYNMLMKEAPPRKALTPTPIASRLSTSPLKSLSTSHLPPLSSLQQGSFVCLTSALEAICACAPPYSLATSLAKSVLVVLVASCHDYIRPFLPLIAFCLLPVGCYHLGLFAEIEEAAAPFEQIVVQGAHEILHESYLPTWSADPSLEIGRAEVDEILVPRHDDINASLFAHWADVEGGMREGAEYLHDRAFFEKSVLTDWDDLVDGDSFFKEMDQVSFNLPIPCDGTPSSLLSLSTTGQEASLKYVFTGSTPRPSKFNLNISGGTRSRSSSISETDSSSADISIPSYETPTRSSALALVGVPPASEPRAPCASVQAPQTDRNDLIANLAEGGEVFEEITPSPTGPSMSEQAFEPRPGYRRRRKHRRRSKNNVDQVEDNNLAAAVDEILSA